MAIVEDTRRITLGRSEVEQAVMSWVTQTLGLMYAAGVTVDFTIEEEYETGDWMARNPPSPRFKGAVVTAKIPRK